MSVRGSSSSIPLFTNGGGIGVLTAVPAGSTNGTPIGAVHAGAIGVRFYLGSSDSITIAFAASQPTSAPTPTVTVTGASVSVWDEGLVNGLNIYVTAKTGTPSFRWY